MELTVDVQGLKGVEDALSEAGPKLAKRALRRGLLAGGTVMLDAIKPHVPVLSGALRDSLVMKVKMSPKEESGTVIIGPQFEKGADRNESPGLYGMFVEFGSIHGAAQPFMRPGFDGSNVQALEAFTAVLSEAVESLKS